MWRRPAPCSLSLNTVRANPAYSGLRVGAVSSGAVQAVQISTIPACQRIGAPGVAARGAGGTEHDHCLGIGGELRRRGLAAFGVAAIVLGIQLQGMADQLAADVLEGDLDAALLVEAERCVGTGQHPVGADLDGAPLGMRITPRSSVTGPTVAAEAACAMPNNAAAAKNHRAGSLRNIVNSPSCRRRGITEALDCAYATTNTRGSSGP